MKDPPAVTPEERERKRLAGLQERIREQQEGRPREEKLPDKLARMCLQGNDEKEIRALFEQTLVEQYETAFKEFMSQEAMKRCGLESWADLVQQVLDINRGTKSRYKRAALSPSFATMVMCLAHLGADPWRVFPEIAVAVRRTMAVTMSFLLEKWQEKTNQSIRGRDVLGLHALNLLIDFLEDFEDDKKRKHPWCYLDDEEQLLPLIKSMKERQQGAVGDLVVYWIIPYILFGQLFPEMSALTCQKKT